MAMQGFRVEALHVDFVVHPVEHWAHASPDRYLKLVEVSSDETSWALLEVKTYSSDKLLEELPYLQAKEKEGTMEIMLKRSHQHYY